MKAKLLAIVAGLLVFMASISAYFRQKALRMEEKAEVARENHIEAEKRYDYAKHEAEAMANKPKDKSELVDRLRDNGL